MKAKEHEPDEDEEEEEAEEEAGEGEKRRKGKKKKFLGDLSEQRSVWDLVVDTFLVSSGASTGGGPPLSSLSASRTITPGCPQQVTSSDVTVARLIFVGNFTPLLQNKKELHKYYEDFWARQNAEVVGPVTGISLALPQSTVHLVEAHHTVIVELLSEIAASEGKSNQFIKDVRVVAMTEDVPQRAFPAWEFRILQYDRAVELAPEESEPEAGQALANSCLMTMLRLGEGLTRSRNQDRALYEASVENLRASQFRELLPTAETISGIIDSKDIFTLREWLAVYSSPVQVDTDPDQIWTVV